MIDLETHLPASILAFATTIHLAMIVLRKHRTTSNTFPWAILPSVVFGTGPWVFPTLAGTAAGIGIHVVWFALCEMLIPAGSSQTVASAKPAAATKAATKPAAVAKPASTKPAAATKPPVAAKPAAAKPAATPAAGPASKDFVAVPVLAVFDESPTIRTFRLLRPEGFSFQAGQFLTVRVQVDGKAHIRCYSISSAPEATGYIEVSVKRQGLVSGMLHAAVRPGSHMMVRPPGGVFTYPGQDDRPIVLVAAGVGITPLVSMLRHAVVAEPTRPVTLLYSARGEQELAFWDELCWLVRRNTQVRVVATLTMPGPAWTGRVGRMDRAFLLEHAADATHALFLICGPAEMIRDVRLALEQAGVAPAQVRSEVFQATASGNATKSEVRGTAAVTRPAFVAEPESEPDGDAEEEPEEGLEAEADESGASLTLSFTQSNRTVSVDGEQTLLDAAEAAGVDIPSICRAGVCRTCRTRVVAGDVHCTSDILGEADHAEGWTLPCVAFAKTDCSLDA